MKAEHRNNAQISWAEATGGNNRMTAKRLIAIAVIVSAGLAAASCTSSTGASPATTPASTNPNPATAGVPCSQNPACSGSSTVTQQQAYQQGYATGSTSSSGFISGGPSEETVCQTYVPNTYSSAGLTAEWQNGCAAGFSAGSSSNAAPASPNVPSYGGGGSYSGASGGGSSVPSYSGGGAYSGADGSGGGFSGAP